MEINKIKFGELCRDKNWKEAVIVFTKESFTEEYSEQERSYAISSGDKYFDPNMGGSSLYGNCLDGKDRFVRLDHYMYSGWEVEYCYITK